MTVENTMFHKGHAPCGRVVDGERHADWDEECLLTDDYAYACGCRQTQHEYHDGSLSRRVVHHNGSVLADELFAAE